MLRQVVTDYLVDIDHEQADQWLATSDTEADLIVQAQRGVAGVLAFRERALSGTYGVPGAVHEALSARGMTA